jgi:hypothetical protein
VFDVVVVLVEVRVRVSAQPISDRGGHRGSIAPTIAEGCPLACTTSQSARSGVAEGWPPGPTFREIIRIDYIIRLGITRVYISKLQK